MPIKEKIQQVIIQKAQRMNSEYNIFNNKKILINDLYKDFLSQYFFYIDKHIIYIQKNIIFKKKKSLFFYYKC